MFETIWNYLFGETTKVDTSVLEAVKLDEELYLNMLLSGDTTLKEETLTAAIAYCKERILKLSEIITLLKA